MLSYPEIEISILILVTFVYAMFDVFNRRNVPNVFVYATIGLGVALALFANSGLDLVIAFVVAAIIGSLGYLLYRHGLLGGGDVLEFVFIALVLPVQLPPIYSNAYQWNIPFVLSVMIAAGYTSLLFIPIYYLGIKRPKRDAWKPEGKNIKSGIVLFAAYLVFIIAIKSTYGISLLGTALILLLAISSVIIMIYERRIYLGMVEFIYPNRLEDGDMIAVNLMDKKDITYFGRRAKFGRLASKKLISQIKGIKKKLPVYRDSVPFSLFIFLGVVISLLFGNLILTIIGL
jgi:hypothetical protein